jgi:hypothetical protein
VIQRSPALPRPALLRAGRGPAAWRRELALAGGRADRLRRLARWLPELARVRPSLALGPLYGPTLAELAAIPGTASEDEEVSRERRSRAAPAVRARRRHEAGRWSATPAQPPTPWARVPHPAGAHASAPVPAGRASSAERAAGLGLAADDGLLARSAALAPHVAGHVHPASGASASPTQDPARPGGVDVLARPLPDATARRRRRSTPRRRVPARWEHIRAARSRVARRLARAATAPARSFGAAPAGLADALEACWTTRLDGPRARGTLLRARANATRDAGHVRATGRSVDAGSPATGSSRSQPRATRSADAHGTAPDGMRGTALWRARAAGHPDTPGAQPDDGARPGDGESPFEPTAGNDPLGLWPLARPTEPGLVFAELEPGGPEDDLAPLAEKVRRILEEEARRHGVDV